MRHWLSALLCAVTSGWSGGSFSTAADADAALPGAGQRLAWAAAYLHQSVLPSGRFVYRRNLEDGTADRVRYNLLRHAGTLFALADYHRAVRPGAAEAGNLRRAATYLVECCIAAVPDAPGALAVWSHPAVTGRTARSAQAKLGGAGLALVAFLTLEQVLPGSTDRVLWRGLGEFLLYMQGSDGSFAAKYIPERGGRDASWVSLYYPGQAALGLVRLYEWDADPRWLRGAMDALRHLSRTREGQARLPADHWALLATARLFEQDPLALAAQAPSGLPWADAEGGQGVRGLLTGHAARLVDSILAEQIDAPGDDCLDGGFSPEGRVAPTATRLEGLSAALRFLPQGPRRERVRAALARGLDFLVRAQYPEGPFRGAYPRLSRACAAGGRRAREARIDYTQHALSAWLLAQRLAARGALDPRRETSRSAAISPSPPGRGSGERDGQ